MYRYIVGGHSAGVAEGIPYPQKIKKDIKKIGEKIESGAFCSNPQGLIDELNEYSEYVLSQIDKFRWTITGDGRDYKTGGIGCSGAKNIGDKPQQSCPHNRLHKLTRQGSAVIVQKTALLEIGQ